MRTGRKRAPTKTSGQGRPKGIPNKINRELKEMILAALGNAGGVDYLTAQAHESPGAFLTLIGKVLPTTLAGDPDQPMKHQWVVSYPQIKPPDDA